MQIMVLAIYTGKVEQAKMERTFLNQYSQTSPLERLAGEMRTIYKISAGKTAANVTCNSADISFV